MLAALCDKAEFKRFAVGSLKRLLWLRDLVLQWIPELQASIRPLSASAKQDIDYIRTSYAILCTLIHQYFDLPFDSTKYPLIVSSSLQRMTEEEDPFAMSYEAWKHATVPHKGICKKLRLLAESTLLSNRPDPRGGPAFAQACKVKGVDERIAADSDVVIHMKNLLKEIDTVTFQNETERVGFATAIDFVIARTRNSNDGGHYVEESPDVNRSLQDWSRAPNQSHLSR
ncbi:hypothetical protein PILCRDRAFT_34 [Piloderma croceum F 1598]|uniref:Uncharacterized protein n=1 Tax=Piloderma croceum (strain F 1598) TaxID=765440 RepID=A0A0C3BZ79_PILCF|nr:hypothetical protein PILCRDRAFT_34 [Piloderma croceum F 1598]